VEWDLLSDISSQALAGAMRGSVARQRALADNIANVDTPGFIRREVQFEEALAEALQRARRVPRRAGEAFSRLDLQVRPDHASPARADGNNVDVDREMTSLAGNSLRFQAASELLAARVRGLRTAIGGGKR
jgi:flagellar basal-body rod protein FlgB